MRRPGPAGKPARLHAAGLTALRALDVCPLVPFETLVRLVGTRHPVSAYQLLARLRAAGLVDVRRVDLGCVVGGQPVSVWSLTRAGRQVLRQAGYPPAVRDTAARARLPYGPPAVARDPRRQRDVPLQVVTYRLLAALLAEREAAGCPVEVQAWEHPWVRRFQAAGRRLLTVTLPAAAVLVPRSAGAQDRSRREPEAILLLPDLGTGPVVAWREALRRLVGLRTVADERASGAPAPEPLLVVGTPDQPGRETRVEAWQSLVRRAGERQAEPPPRARVLAWEPRSGQSRRATRQDQVLDLVGRHACLTVQQLAALLGVAAAQAVRVRAPLLARGWVRLLPPEELPRGALGLPAEEGRALGLAELTPAGRAELARWLGLRSAGAARHHGLIGGERGHAGKRRRLLEALAHTLGTNDVFVAFAIAARTATEQGGDEALVEWRGAAACERRHCKPDGYGLYRRGAGTYGFLVEYDRGTERAAHYAAKFNAYYAYRDSGEAARDYEGFPTLLFVTASQAAEDRIAEQALRTWARHGGDTLPVRITTTERIQQHREGILGPIWRTPAAAPPGQAPVRDYWLPGGPPRGLFGVGRRPVLSPRLIWPTARDAELAERRARARRRPGGTGYQDQRPGVDAEWAQQPEAHETSRWSLRAPAPRCAESARLTSPRCARGAETGVDGGLAPRLAERTRAS